MYNLHSWNTTPLTATQTNLFQKPITDAASWFSQPMQTVQTNNDYQNLGKDFVEKFSQSNLLGVSYTSTFYSNESIISVHVHQTSKNQVFECTGFNQYITKMNELGVSVLKFSQYVYTVQPIGKKSILTSMHGQLDINNITYKFILVSMVEVNNGTYKIVNQIYDIFM